MMQDLVHKQTKDSRKNSDIASQDSTLAKAIA